MTFAFGLPMIVTAVCFVRILVALRTTEKKFGDRYGKKSVLRRDSARNVRDQYVSSLLIAFVYITSWFPYAGVCFMFFHHLNVPIWFEYFSIHLAKSSTVTSTIIFCLIEKRVRVFFKKNLLRRFSCTVNPDVVTGNCFTIPKRNQNTTATNFVCTRKEKKGDI